VRPIKLFIVVVVAVLEVATTSPPATAAPGRLDRSFSDDGMQTAFPRGASAHAVALDEKGRIVVAGYTVRGDPDVAVARFLSNGAPDGTFGHGGRVAIDLGGNDFAFDVAIQPDGGIVVAGRRAARRDAFAVLRLRPSGRLDLGFGRHGVVLTRFGRLFQGAKAVAIGPRGTILAVGSTSNGTTTRSALARYRFDGDLDTSFGGDGKVTTDLSPSDEQLEDVAILLDGRAVVAGYAEVGLVPRFVVARYMPTGRLDVGFGDRGRATVSIGAGADIAHALAVQPDGKLALAGYASGRNAHRWGFARFGPKGHLDRTFGGDGAIAFAPAGGDGSASDLAVLTNGELLAVGRVSAETGDDDIGLVRLRPGGGLDPAFGVDGIAAIDLFDDADAGRELAIQGNGKLIVAGECVVDGRRRFAVGRYRTG
jgi:uncharacterized delta-60 repeat protein